MRLLLVEDDLVLSGQLCQSLTQAGYAVDCAYDGEDACHLGLTEPYDVAVLDLGLPLLDGSTVLRRWRQQGQTLPVLVLTARDSWHDKVESLDSGADDYMTKPFRREELLARLRALLRRVTGQPTPVLNSGAVMLDPRSAQVRVDGQVVSLTSHEYRVLSYLMHHKGRVVGRSELIDHIYAQDFDRDSNTIEVFVGRLRRKLGVDIIHTVRGLGYRVGDPC